MGSAVSGGTNKAPEFVKAKDYRASKEGAKLVFCQARCEKRAACGIR